MGCPLFRIDVNAPETTSENDAITKKLRNSGLYDSRLVYAGTDLTIAMEAGKNGFVKGHLIGWGHLWDTEEDMIKELRSKIPKAIPEDYIYGGKEDDITNYSSSLNGPLDNAFQHDKKALVIYNGRKLQKVNLRSSHTMDEGLHKFIHNDKKLEAIVAIAHLIY